MTSFFLLLLSLSPSRADTNADIAGWIFYSQGQTGGIDNYEAGLDRATRHGGHAAAMIRAKVKDPDGSGTLMQVIKSKLYVGKRVRLSAYLKTDRVEGRAGLWMRVEGKDHDRPLTWDNMQNRPVHGTTEWAVYQIVLDVPPESIRVLFGTSLFGTGTLWVDDFKFEVVDASVPTTDPLRDWPNPEEPRNMSFESK